MCYNSIATMNVCVPDEDQFDSLPYQLFLIAEHLSARLLILAVHVLSWQGVVSHFRNAICHSLGMQLKV